MFSFRLSELVRFLRPVLLSYIKVVLHRALKLSVQHSLDDVDNDFWMRNGFELERSCVGHGDVGAGNTNYGCVL